MIVPWRRRHAKLVAAFLLIILVQTVRLGRRFWLHPLLNNSELSDPTLRDSHQINVSVSTLNNYSNNRALERFRDSPGNVALRYHPRELCRCSTREQKQKKSFQVGMGRPGSRCSPEATAAGMKQRVLAYVYYKKNKRDYVQDLREILPLARRYYPGWLVRLYAKVESLPQFCGLICGNRDVLYFCPIEFMDQFRPVEGKNFSRADPRHWRFIPLGDPTVSQFLSRDLDSRPGQREVDAVKEWEMSRRPFHAMRDHPYHSSPILAGMWGGNRERIFNPSEAKYLSHQLVFRRSKGRKRNGDQKILDKFLYQPYHVNGSILIHDSYHCRRFKDSFPFPTRRKELRSFVGKPINTSREYDQEIVSECPVECRPKYGLDWTYC